MGQDFRPDASINSLISNFSTFFSMCFFNSHTKCGCLHGQLFLGILTFKKMLCFVPHKWFNYARVTSWSFTITFRKLVEVDGPLPYCFPTPIFYMPHPWTKRTFQFTIFCSMPPTTFAAFWYEINELRAYKCDVLFWLAKLTLYGIVPSKVRYHLAICPFPKIVQ